MKLSFFRQIFNFEYVLSSILVMGLVYLMGAISDLLPEADETSFLNPIFDRIDFLNIDDVSLDAIFAMKPAGFPDARIVIVNVGEVAPTPDGKIAAAVERIHGYGARAIGVDVIFDDLHFERFGEDRAWEKEALVRAFGNVDNVVLVNGYNNKTLLPAFTIDPLIAMAVPYYGYASLEKDDDGVVRRFWPYRTINEERWLAFPAMILQVYDPGLTEPLLRLPEEPQIIYYSATHNQFKGQTIPIDDVIDHPDALAPIYKKLFENAIVLIGFVNEGGFWYPDDTHKTPMGKKITITERDGSSRMGMDGPDMSGLLIHANVINMMLNKEFIQPVPDAVEWALVFLLAYISIAVYRVLRTKPTSRVAIGTLITSILIVESLLVFFIPIVAFFNLGIKISYDLMATAVVLFIPANAMVNKLRVTTTRWIVLMRNRRVAYPPLTVLSDVFQDDEAFPLYVRIVHASLFNLHFVFAIESMHTRSEARAKTAFPRYPALSDWVDSIPAIGGVFKSNAGRERSHAHFYRYLAGMKDLFLRDSYMKDFFFHTEFSKYNPHHYFEEWEIILPHIRRMFSSDLGDYSKWVVVDIDDNGQIIRIGTQAGTSIPGSGIQSGNDKKPGIYVYNTVDGVLLRMSPLFLYAECKLHRKKELFVFSAAVPRQIGRDTLAVYYGETVACEAVPSGTEIEELELIISNDLEPSTVRS